MKAVLQLIRLPAGFSAASNIIAAHIIATAGVVQFPELILTLLVSLCLYFGGMGLNDCFDYQEDRRERSQRPLPSGQLSLSSGWLISLGLIALGLMGSLAISIMTFMLAMILSVLIILYNSKTLPLILSSITMGSCRFFNWLLGLSVVSIELSDLLIPLPLLLYVAGLTLLSEAESGSHSRSLLYKSGIFFVFCIVTVAGMIVMHPAWLWLSLPVLGVIVVHFTRVLLPVWNDFTPDSVQKIIRQLVMGVIIVDALILCIFGYPVWAVCILLLLLPGKSVGKMLYVS